MEGNILVSHREDFLLSKVSPSLSLLPFNILQTGREEYISCDSFPDSGTGYHYPEQSYDNRENLRFISVRSRNQMEWNGGGLLTVPRTLKKAEGNSMPIWIVEVVKTPSGKVNPHHPILNGNLLRLMLAKAKNSHTRPNPHIITAVRKPITYRISPACVVVSLSVWVRGNTFIATIPNFWIP